MWKLGIHASCIRRYLHTYLIEADNCISEFFLNSSIQVDHKAQKRLLSLSVTMVRIYLVRTKIQAIGPGQSQRTQ